MLGFFETGFSGLTWGSIVMLIIGGVLLYLGIAKNMEPLLLVPIGFGIILVNLPLGGLMATIVQGKVQEAYMVGGEPAGHTAFPTQRGSQGQEHRRQNNQPKTEESPAQELLLP